MKVVLKHRQMRAHVTSVEGGTEVMVTAATGWEAGVERQWEEQ